MKIEKLEQILKKMRKHDYQFRKKICVCEAGSCQSSGASKIREKFQSGIEKRGLEKEIEVVPTGCMGLCNQGPLVRILPDETIYHRAAEGHVDTVIDQHILKDQPVRDQLLTSDRERDQCAKSEHHPFYRKQKRIVLENCGSIDPRHITEYIAVGGFRALYKALHELSHEEVIETVEKSGLRGRGGAGYPTGIKWRMVRNYPGDAKYVICNGDEGDPGAFMDRSVLEGDPFRVIEGMAIAAYAVGAQKGYLYVRAEYPLAIQHFEIALKQCRLAHLLGKKILDQDFDFDVEIRVGAGAFVCGEETALIASIEGQRGIPRPRPPYPAESGLWGKPTLINNVETFAAIAPIVWQGAEWYRSFGTPKSPGTKVFALAGKVKNTGLIEVPMGISLREIIFDIGGGIPDGKKFKAAQTGGPSGGCIPEQHLDTPVDYEHLAALGSIMGSGGLIVMDETSCMVDVARFFMEFCMDESCGKCVPCRVGTKQMHDLLQKICRGEAGMRDLDLLEELAPMVKDTSLCGLGMTAPNPLLSTLRYFRGEYLEHIEHQRCPAGVCRIAAAQGVRS